ncbi:hypothetical protein J2T13_000800 [Paenibacillus sp. DS2015]|uniref:glycosyl hydrolase family 28-related protein n=1 Tax=Paenibacillus sp. DS2015 TaxID=3373917 RepID=UPI003D257D75
MGMNNLSSSTVNVRDFGATGDGSTDDTNAIQLAINHCSATKTVLYFPVGKYIVTRTIYLPDVVRLLGSNSAMMLQGDQIGPERFSPCRMIYRPVTEGTLFLKNNGNQNLYLQMDNMCITSNDIYYANEEWPTSGTVFKNMTLSGHSVISNCQIQSFNIIFDHCTINYAVRVINNTFREIGQYFTKQCQVGDCYFAQNYFSGSSIALDGATIFDVYNMNMTTIVQNWFELCRVAIGSGFINRVTISANIFDYAYRGIVGEVMHCTFEGNVFDHASKKNALTRFKNLSSNSILKTKEWICMELAAVNGLSIIGNVANEADQMIHLERSSMKDIITSGNLNSFEDTTRIVPINPEKTVRIVMPKSGYFGVSHGQNIRLEELNYQRYNTEPKTSLFPGRIAYIDGVWVTLRDDYVWVNQEGNPFGFGGANLCSQAFDVLWTYSGSAKNIVYSANKKKVTFLAQSNWTDITLNIPIGQNEKLQFYSETDLLNSTGKPHLIEIHYYNAASIKIGTEFITKVNVETFIQTPDGTVRLEIKLRGQYAGQTYTYKIPSVYRYHPKSRYTVYSTGTNKYKITVDESGALMTSKMP